MKNDRVTILAQLGMYIPLLFLPYESSGRHLQGVGLINQRGTRVSPVRIPGRRRSRIGAIALGLGYCRRIW